MSRRRRNANRRLGMEAGVFVVGGRRGVQLDLPHEHRARQALDRQFELGGLVGEIPDQQAVDVIVLVVRGQAVDAGAAGVEAEALAGQAREQLEREIRRADVVLEIEEPVRLRHAVPPPGHERNAARRHERRKLTLVHVIVADVHAS